jgi:quinol monooxygenase YgiN
MKFMIKSILCFSVLSFFASQPLLASEQDPLTAEVKAHLSSPVITIVAEGFLTPEGVAKVKSEGPAYVAKSRREPGNIQYQLQFDASDPGHIFWYEQYASAADFDKHVTSDYSKAWVDMLKPLSTKPIIIHFLNKLEHIQK